MMPTGPFSYSCDRLIASTMAAVGGGAQGLGIAAGLPVLRFGLACLVGVWAARTGRRASPAAGPEGGDAGKVERTP